MMAFDAFTLQYAVFFFLDYKSDVIAIIALILSSIAWSFCNSENKEEPLPHPTL